MKLLVVLSCFIAVALASPTGEWQQLKSPMEDPKYQELLSKLYSNPDFINQKPEGKIVGGSIATRNQFPYQTYLYIDDNWLCGGSIISKTYILTAAHCIYQKNFADVYVGSINRNEAAPWETRVMKKDFVQHARYNDDTAAYDIALIQTPEIPINDANIGIVNLPTKSEAAVNIDGLNAIVSGFGRFSDNFQETTANLLYAEVQIINYFQCAQVFGSAYVNSNHVCVAGGIRGSCGGDSGGPLTATINGRRVQVGIVSFGAAAGCQLGYPSAYTRVGSYLDWISANSGATEIPTESPTMGPTTGPTQSTTDGATDGAAKMQVGILWAALAIAITSRFY